MIYRNRSEAGQYLAQLCEHYRYERPIVLGIAHGGVSVAFEVALHLDAMLDILCVRKLSYDSDPELAVGAVAYKTHKDIFFRCLDIADKKSFFNLQEEYSSKLAQAINMNACFNQIRPPLDITNRTILLVDDGIATGSTMLVAIKNIKSENPNKIIVATPVCAQSCKDAIQACADEVICPYFPQDFIAVGNYYGDFSPITTQEVLTILKRSRSEIEFKQMVGIGA